MKSQKKLLIYGTGETFLELRQIIRWDNISLIGFVETVPSSKTRWGNTVYSVGEISNIEFDYILIATSAYEDEIRKKLNEIGIGGGRIISGSLDHNNIFENEFLFDRANYSILQNTKIWNNVRFVNERNLFWDYAKGISWIDPKLTLSPGGMAVGYDYLYVMCRILEIIKPKNILELGLGQSSKLILNYYKNHSCQYSIIEQNREWYEFFLTENDVPQEVNVHIRPMITSYNETYDQEINSFSEVETIVRNKKFSFISIDGPWGCDGLSRGDLLPYIPECLEDNFVIMLDDYNRAGEKEMIRLLELKMEKSNVSFLKKVYGSKKQFCIITSTNNPFLCTLYSPAD